MYIIMNNTTNRKIEYFGGFPIMLLEEMLNNGDDIIVMSLYSNTIKIPYSVECNGLIEWEWKDYHFK